MTDARCKLCAEKNVGISEIISGGHGDRYQVNALLLHLHTACAHISTNMHSHTQ